MGTTTSLVTAFTGMTVTGVTTTQAYEPEVEDTADLPLMFPDDPVLSDDDELYGSVCSTSWEMRLWIIIEPDGQSTPAVKYAASITMMDNLKTALETLKATLKAAGTFVFKYTVGKESRNVGGIPYYAVYADITAAD